MRISQTRSSHKKGVWHIIDEDEMLWFAERQDSAYFREAIAWICGSGKYQKYDYTNGKDVIEIDPSFTPVIKEYEGEKLCLCCAREAIKRGLIKLP